MDQRLQFIGEARKGERAIAELCRAFGISRRVGYKWLDRYDLEGPKGLEDQTRAPHNSPQTTAAAVARLIVDARLAHPRWGPRKLVAWLQPRCPDTVFPAASTCGEILRRQGLVAQRKKRGRGRPSDTHPAKGAYTEPNALWCADYKGDFRTRDGTPCHPLTISDGFSRLLIRAEAVAGTRCRDAIPVFEEAFREYGLPLAIRTDNGPPFASCRALHGLTRLAVWWLKLGIWIDRIAPGKPQQNGRHERMHRTLKAETATPARANLREQQRAFDLFRERYNRERPHEALEQVPPISVYQSSPRPFPGKLRDPEYPTHFRIERACRNGRIAFRAGERLYLAPALAGELLGLEQTEDGTWRVHFGSQQLGLVDERRGVRILPTPLVPPRWPTGGLGAPRE